MRECSWTIAQINEGGLTNSSIGGWILRELLAPHKMQFYNKRWKFMGTVTQHVTLVVTVTGIG